MKSIYTYLILLLSTTLASAQCMIDPWSLEKRVSTSTTIVEARVVAKECTWDAAHENIYTVNTLEVYRVFKGQVNTQTIELVTEGGLVGDEMLRVSPALTVELGEVGVFMLKANTITLSGRSGLYQPYASVQSFIKYDLHSVMAFDIQKAYTSIAHDLYSDILRFTNEAIQVKKNFDPEAAHKTIKPLSPPVITSLSANTATSGTSTNLTINGSNFGATRGVGAVGFLDANVGGNVRYYPTTGWYYKSWTDTKIIMVIPSRASTGKVQVINNAGETGESTNDLTIEWSHLNVNFPVGVDTPAFELVHINDNGEGGYSWQMNTTFAANGDAVSSFIRALEEWRCETGMNWKIGANTTVDEIGSDDVNIVRFTSFGDSRLGVCYSRYQGCFVSAGTDMRWYVTETDIDFDSTVNWYYGTGSPASTQFDFESVATHELGHGHQLGHVRDAAKVMHFSIANGQRKPDLVSTDIAAGNYVRNKSNTAFVCSRGVTSSILVTECAIRPPSSSFTTNGSSFCLVDTVRITNISDGDIQNYEWDFGAGASIDSSSLSGPFSIAYSSGGAKQIRLIVSNTMGSDTLLKTIEIQDGYNVAPIFTSDDTFCIGRIIHTVTNTEGAIEYMWSLSDGGRLTADLLGRIQVEWQDTGDQFVSLYLNGKCGQGPTTVQDLYVRSEPVSSFTETSNGLTVAFTNTSRYADSYLWNFGDGNTSTEENPEYKYADKGQYSVTLDATNQCTTTPASRSVSVAYGASVAQIKKDIVLYPNPVRVGSTLYVKDATFKTYKLYSAEGKLVQSGDLVGGSILLDKTATGIFMLVLQNENDRVSQRITIIE